MQDHTSGLFVDDAFGSAPGTLPMGAVGLEGAAVTPQPSIAVSFATRDTGCGTPTAYGLEVADTPPQQGQGMHRTFGRADTRNTMGATGPDFRTGFVDPAPASNADIGRTIAQILHLTVPSRGKLLERPLSSEAMPGGAVPGFSHRSARCAPDANGRITQLDYQAVGEAMYFDAAGYPGRTPGLGSADGWGSAEANPGETTASMPSAKER